MTRYKNSVLKQLQDLTVDALKIAIENLKRERDGALEECERLKTENAALRKAIKALCQSNEKPEESK